MFTVWMGVGYIGFKSAIIYRYSSAPIGVTHGERRRTARVDSGDTSELEPVAAEGSWDAVRAHAECV